MAYSSKHKSGVTLEGRGQEKEKQEDGQFALFSDSPAWYFSDALRRS